ncbi:hypothetical protein K4K54_009365 [Colletotrichum sp. SAR 10_86]|nr:hypothetical protein K4K54_009365 [Colletotrichum sp. SAR 10_86]
MEQAFSNRRVQMKTIAEAAMSRTEKESRTKSNFDAGMKVVELARDVGTFVMQNFPQAALPWAGVCAALQLFRNPLTESQAQRDGMVRVIIRMNWYCELDSQLSEKSSSGLLTALEQKMITLFEALLAFLMRSVCSCFKNRIGQTLRDALKLNQWEQALEDIKELEEEFRHDAEYEGLAAIRSDLGKLLEFAKEEEFQVLKKMNLSLEKLVSERITERESQCMQALRLGDPKQQKLIIENSKGRQNKDLGSWISETDQFGAWRKANESSVLWIHGDPGKGKTMLLCEIIDSLQCSISNSDTLSYFFCQATDPRSNTFAAILRGIVYDLAKKRPDLVQHVEDIHHHAGTKAFSEEGSWVTLTEILLKMTDTLAPGTTYFVIDALDECQKDRNLLLRFIVDKALAQPSIKWILSSRNENDIQHALGENSRILSLSLEANAENVSQAVHTFIEDRVKDLAKKKHYDEAFAEAVKHRLLQGAQGTFLWVALNA